MGMMNFAELLDSSVSILRKYSKSFILFNLGYWAIAGIALIVVLTVMTLGMTGILISTNGEPAGLITFMILIAVVALSMGYSNHVGAIHLASQEVLMIPRDAAQAIGSSVKSIFRVTGLVIIGAVPVIPLGMGVWKLVEGSVMKLAGKSSVDWITAFGSADQRILLTLAGILAVSLVLVVLISAYLTLFTFALQALVLEGKGPVQAVRRSIQLIRGRFWHFYAVISLVALVTAGIGVSLDSFFLLIAGLVELGLHFVGVESGTGFTFVYMYGRGAANFFYALLFNSLGAVIYTQLYYNRLFETEGYDLILRISRLPAAGDGQEAL